MTWARELGEYYSTVDSNGIAEHGSNEMRRLLVDYIGVAIGGSATDTGQIVSDFAADMGGREDATVIGREGRFPAVNAAFANAVSVHSLELDDVDDLALFHYGPPVYSATLAVAQRVRASGRDVLAAALSGCEVMHRISHASNPSLRNRGFHTTPVCGVFGGAVAAGRLLGLTADEMTSALGLAGAQASGLMEMYGTSMQKRINPGPAARNAVTAALLAQAGFSGADTIFDGDNGFAKAFCDEFDSSKLLESLDRSYTIDIEFKPYSSARPIHNAIDCVLNIASREDLTLDDVESVVVHRHPDWADYHAINSPRNYHEAQVSLPYSVAVALAFGRALPAEYAEPHLSNPDITRVSELVKIVPDNKLARGVSCRLTLTTRDGRTLESTVDYPKGSSVNRMTDADLTEKFSSLAASSQSRERVAQLLELVADVENIDDINTVMALTQ